MKKNRKKMLKILDKDFEINAVNNVGVIELCAVLFISILSGIVVYFFIIKILEENPGYLLILSLSALLLSNFYLIYLVISSIKNKNKLDKKYGKNREKRTAKILSILKKEYNIEDLQEYYSEASELFKKEVIDIFFKEEIAKKLNISNNFDNAELINKILNEEKIEIQNS